MRLHVLTLGQQILRDHAACRCFRSDVETVLLIALNRTQNCGTFFLFIVQDFVHSGNASYPKHVSVKLWLR